jgi:hypothetical protein
MNPKIGFSIWLMFFMNIIFLVVGIYGNIVPEISLLGYLSIVLTINLGMVMVILSYIMGEKHESRIRRI